MRASTLSAQVGMLAGALAKATAVPVAGDFIEWCRDELGWNIQFGLNANQIDCPLTMPLPDLKARLERYRERELSKRFRKHWSFDGNRLAFWRQAIEAIEQYEGRA